MSQPRINNIQAATEVELTVLLPCLNESQTVGICVQKALKAINELGISGEVLVVDNGSNDRSGEIAQKAGARVIYEPRQGYGYALLAGIEAARGKFIIMADADDSYDLSSIAPFLDKLKEGYDVVQGCRFPSGGGKIMPGAMPWLHKWVGNPLFTFLARWWFKCPVHDINCGMRGFKKDFVQTLQLRCTGMEFANEMIIKASLYGGKITEVPIILWPDGRRGRKSHLRTLRDGWRTLRFYLLYSPKWLFLVPGTFLMVLGIIGSIFPWISPEVSLSYPLFGMISLITGYQAVLFALLTKAFAINEGLLPMDQRMELFFRIMNLERGILAGLISLSIGAILLIYWISSTTNYSVLLKYALPGGTLCAIGIQTILFSFFASLLGLKRK